MGPHRVGRTFNRLNKEEGDRMRQQAQRDVKTQNTDCEKVGEIHGQVDKAAKQVSKYGRRE